MGIVVVLFACSTQKGVVKVNTQNPENNEQDSVEYGLETFDAKFETWYLMNNSPAKYRSQEYYEGWNDRYVIAWNYKCTTSRNAFFEPIIGYDPGVDYGFDLNHELFHYFQYVERVLKIEIIPGGGPRSGIITFY